MSYYAFVSYHHSQRSTARNIKDILNSIRVVCFLAHEDIKVSEEWRLRILEEIEKADLFICLLSKEFYASAWCTQELGIAAFRKDMTFVPLSLDDSVPLGFVAHFQCTKIKSGGPSVDNLLPALAKHDFRWATDAVIDLVGRSDTFRSAESHFQLLLPYIRRLTDAQMRRLLNHIVENDQIHHAGLCASKYIPPLLTPHGDLLKPAQLKFLREVCQKYIRL